MLELLLCHLDPCYTLSKGDLGCSHCGTAETNLTSIPEDVGLIPGWEIWRCRELGYRVQARLGSCIAETVV